MPLVGMVVVVLEETEVVETWHECRGRCLQAEGELLFGSAVGIEEQFVGDAVFDVVESVFGIFHLARYGDVSYLCAVDIYGA